MQYEYRWNSGVPVQGELKKIDPNEFAIELERIEGNRGKVTSKILAEEAKTKNHIAHSFIYNVGQKQASALYYEDRARRLISNLRVIAITPEAREVRARIAMEPTQFNADPDHASEGEHHHFMPAQEIAADDSLRDQHRHSLLRRLNLIRQELIDFDEFAEVVNAINKVLKAA